MIKEIKNIPMFSELAEEQLQEIINIARPEKRGKNELIFTEGDIYKGFYVLIKGNVKVFHVTSEGKEVIIHLIRPFETFAEIPLFDGNRYPVNAESLQESELILIPKDEFTELLKNNYEITFKMLGGFAKRLRLLTQKIENLSSKEVTERLVRFILQEITSNNTINTPEPFLKLTISKAAVAGYLGTITETLSRSLKKLQDENIIRVEGKRIFISDLPKLKILAK